MLNVCIVGATGLVGREMLKEVEELNNENINIDLYASARSKGKQMHVGNKRYFVNELNESIDFNKYDIALFSAGKSVSIKYAPLFAKAGCYVIDNSSAFRMDENVPLLAMGVNLEDFEKYNSKIIANPNCSTIQSVVVLNKLSKKYKIKDIDYVTYQSVSGSGIDGIKDLALTQQGLEPQKYEAPIYNNIIPKIDNFMEDNYTFEEEKMIFETKKILSIDAGVSATCVRVPVFNSHTVQIRVEFEEDININEVIEELGKQEHLQVLDGELPMPLAMKDKKFTAVGRIRKHRSNDNVIFLMCVADNLKVGASTNACIIAKYLIEEVLC